MALTITKKAKQKPIIASQLDDDETTGQSVNPEVVDEYLALEAKIDKHDAKIEAERKRFGELKKQIVAVVDETADADAKVTLKGTGNKELEISARTMQTEITDMEQAKKFLGTTTFWQVVKIGLGDLKAYLPKPQYEQVTKTEQTGSRRIKTIG